MSDLIQKAAEFGKMSAKFKREHGGANNLAVKGWWLQPKYDGVHAIINLANGTAMTREGNDLPSIKHIAERLSDATNGIDAVLQGEVWIPDTPFKDISGAARRHARQDHLGVVLYDFHHGPSFREGADNERYYSRYGKTCGIAARFNGDPFIRMTHNFPSWEGLDVYAMAANYVKQGGYDGAILRHPHSMWTTGYCKEGEVIKIKPTCSLDLACVGYSTKKGEKTGREVAVLTVQYRGVNTDVGSGVPHDLDPASCVGKIIEVECMAVNPNNTLREPRFKAVRFDKTKADE